eukprot:c52188_g1_i1.p1 GENE.c52188_g1_i1~~c52188_g1_i1.p1  ORF type:complete len:433 (-),score=49.51 c52188_g1_i1:51-1349(-)
MRSNIGCDIHALAMAEIRSLASPYAESYPLLGTSSSTNLIAAPLAEDDWDWDPSSVLEPDFGFFNPSNDMCMGSSIIDPTHINFGPTVNEANLMKHEAVFDTVSDCAKSRSDSLSSLDVSIVEDSPIQAASVCQPGNVCAPEDNLGIEDYKKLLADARTMIQHLTRELLVLRQSNSPRSTVSSEISPPMASYHLEPLSQVQTLWYAERPYPSITMQLVQAEPYNQQTRLALKENLQVKVSVLDANDQPVADVLTGPPSSVGFTFQMADNVVTLAGIRFGTVSSKHGGFFRLCVSVCSSSMSPYVATWVSEKIQVLSYRLYNSPKVPFEQLSPQDDLARVQGIGSLYAKRFASLNIKCVADLAALEFDGSNNDRDAQGILDALRRDRGAMTRPKLEKYIKQARSIVKNWELKSLGKRPAEDDDTENPQKRICL